MPFSSVYKFLSQGLLCSALCLSHAQANQSFDDWKTSFKKLAREQGISKKTLSQAIDTAKLNQKILSADRKQPEFSKTFFEYINKAVSSHRIFNGRKALKRHFRLLEQVEKKYGVPAEYIVAFWGMETNYGHFKGSFSTINALVTLAYDPRRSGFFTKELIAALRILDKGYISIENMKGSWAGAVGHVQFMPSNYLRYAVDGDGDGQINLWTSLPDAFYSAAHFLNKLGWKQELPWGQEIQLDQKFNFALADAKTKRSIAEWQKLGVSVDTKLSPDTPAVLVLPSDYRGPAFLAYHNYHVIKRWNNSSNYAIGVGYLSHRILGLPALTKKQPKDDKGLSQAHVKEIQTRLNQLGFNAGIPDGIPGSKTRHALRLFQKQYQLPADGFPSLHILKKLRKVRP